MELKSFFKLSLVTLFIMFNCFAKESFAKDGLRWVKVYYNKLNTDIAVSLNASGLEGNQYSCGDHCQMIQLLTTWNSDHGALLINLRNPRCQSSALISVPFEMDDGQEELITPLTTYDVNLNSTFCHQNVKAEVTGSPDFARIYRIDLIS